MRSYKPELLNINIPHESRLSNTSLVESKFDAPFGNNKANLLLPKTKAKKKAVPPVLNYNAWVPEISRIIRQHVYLLCATP